MLPWNGGGGGFVVGAGVGGSVVLPHPVTFQRQSQTLLPGLNTRSAGQSNSYRYPFEH